MNAPKLQAAASLLIVLAAGCTTMGTGFGSSRTGKNPVNFSWQSSDGGISGDMTATQADGKVFTGQFFQITSNTTDEAMPDLTGTDLAREIRKLRPDIPIVLMSGYGGAQLVARAASYGVNEVLRKPLQNRELAEALARVRESECRT